MNTKNKNINRLDIINKILNTTLILLLLCFFAYKSFDYAKGDLQLLEITPISDNTLTQTHFNELVNAINAFDLSATQAQVFQLNNLSECSWYPLETNQSIICPSDQYIAEICLSNQNQNCAQFFNIENTASSNIAGAIKCCDLK